MNESYLNSVSNTVLSSKPSTAVRLLLMVLFVCLFSNIDNVNAATRTASVTGNWNNTATWGGSSVPTISDDVVIPNGKTVTVTADAFVKSIIVNNGGTLNVNSPVVLTVGTIGTSATTQVVDFQNGSYVNVYTGASMIVYGLLNNSNNSDNVKFDGTVSVDGNITVGNGSTITGSGSLSSTGTVTGAGTVFGSINDCTSGNGCNYGCSANTISADQAICSGSTATLTGNTGTGYSYQWQSSTTSYSTGFSNISGATSSNYTTSSLATTTYYRRIVSVGSGCSTSNSNVIKVTVNPSLPASVSISASASSICTGTSVTFTATPTNGGTTPTYQWKLNGVNVGTNSVTYTNATLANGNTVTCVMTSNATCATGSPATSNTVTMVVSSSAPSVPGAISGSTTQCANTTSQVYSVAAVANATSYNWYVPSGWTITSGSGTNSITVTIGGSSSSGNVNVNAINTCGTGYGPYQYVTVNPIPSAPGTASSYSSTCTGFTAQWAYTSYATKYYLDVATDSGFTSIVPVYNNLDVGNNLTQVLTGLTAGTTYYYRVRAYGSCGTSANSSTMTYATSAVPTVAPVASAATSPDCSSVTVNWSTVANATGYYLDIATDSGFTSFVSGYNNYNIGYSATSFYAAGLPSGTLYYRLRGYNSCGVITASSNTISFSTISPIGGTVSPTQTICSGTSPSNLTLSGYTTTNTAILKWQKASDAAFTSPMDIPISTATLSAISIGNLTANTYFRAVVQNQFGSWCTSNSNSVLITVTPATATPSVTLTQPTCSVSTGTITVNTPVPGAGITYTITGPSPAAATVTNSTGVFSGLMAGTYDVTANNTSSCSVSAATNVTINESVTNAWNGASWSNGTPNNTQKLVFTGNYPPAVDPNVDITGCSCLITGGATVRINSGRTLTITNEVTVVGGGTLTFENNASLVQINNVENSGNVIYKRTTSSVLTSDYTYWSSPVASQNLDISPSYVSGMFYSYDDFATPEDWKRETASTVMLVGKGYIIRGPEIASPPPPPGLYNATFVGVPNNGTKIIAIGSTGTSNLLGNPYPSAINADAFLATNSTLIEGTIYFWTHNTAIQLASDIASGKAGSGVYAYTSDDYASYNVTGGVGTGTGNFENGVEETLNKPTGKIAVGQAFFTTSLGAGTVAFNNDMRLSSGGAILDNSQFFKTKNPNKKTTNTIEKHRVWLNMTNKEGAFKQTLVGYVTDATNDYDSRFDGESFDANEFIDFYSINQDKNLVIQGRALPFDENDEVPLGYRTTIDGNFTINIDQVDGALANQAVFLEDKLTNTFTDLKSGNYTFNTTTGTFNDRFVLRYTNKTLGTGDFDAAIDQVVVSIKNKQIKINSFANTIDKVLIYDMSGRLICQKDKVNNSELLLTDIVSNHQTLIVKTRLQNGKIVTDKIIY